MIVFPRTKVQMYKKRLMLEAQNFLNATKRMKKMKNSTKMSEFTIIIRGLNEMVGYSEEMRKHMLNAGSNIEVEIYDLQSRNQKIEDPGGSVSNITDNEAVEAGDEMNDAENDTENISIDKISLR